jgi:diguanylate cyclase (GGDEF)-like protein
VANVLRQDLRRNDVIGRYGGEEFSLLLPETVGDGACVVAERYRKRIEEYDLHAGGDHIKLTASFGVAELAADLADIDALVRRADAAMYQAKHQGRNRVVVASQDGATERNVVGT